jgi:predicted DCC family thiol-disulfide oxidoreductase YuxK
MRSESLSKRPREAWLVYDGDCPFCSAYVRHVRFNANYGKITMLNAREPHPVADAVAASFDLDAGMVLKLGDDHYFGADCIHVLALLSDTRGVFGRLNGWIFRHRWLARALYPALRAGRNLTLVLLGRRKIGHRAHDGSETTRRPTRPTY